MLTQGYGNEDEDDDEFTFLDLFEQHLDDKEDEHPSADQNEPAPAELVQLVENRIANQKSCAEEIQAKEEEVERDREKISAPEETIKPSHRQLVAELCEGRVVEAEAEKSLECGFVRPAGVPPTCARILSEAGVGTGATPNEKTLLQTLSKLEKGVQHFCEYVPGLVCETMGNHAIYRFGQWFQNVQHVPTCSHGFTMFRMHRARKQLTDFSRRNTPLAQVRHVEGIISPSQCRGSTDANENETNLIRHQLAMARQHSMFSASRCSRAEAWMSAQSSLSQNKRHEGVPVYKPIGVEPQVLVVKSGTVQLGVVLMVFRGSVSNRMTKTGKVTRRWSVSKTVCSELPATSTRALHVALLSSDASGTLWRGSCVSQAGLFRIGKNHTFVLLTRD